MEIEREQGEILVASQGRELARAVEPHLASDGLSVRTVDEYGVLRGRPGGWDPILVVVDLQPPSTTWLQQCWEVQSAFRVALIVILPWPEPDMATAILNLGADDCLARPISSRELALRIRAVLRRTTYVRLPAAPLPGRAQDGSAARQTSSVPLRGASTRRRRS